MHYTDTKDHSAELLRIALSHMGRHNAALNPLTFTLWYEYAAGGNQRLNAAVDEAVKSGAKLGDEQVLKLCQEHVFPPEQGTLDRVRDDMQQLMLGMSRSASEASRHAGDYGAQLSELSSALDANNDTQIRPRLDGLVAETGRMKGSMDQLRSQVDASQREIERLRTELERARSEAMTDPLTGLCNRKGFDAQMQQMLAKLPSAGCDNVLVMLDIDHFKAVNDQHGHLTGDRVLQGMGQILRTVVKHPGAETVRYGGEEFAILLPDIALHEAQRCVESVCENTRAMKIRNRSTQEVLVTVTLSAGVARCRVGDGPSELIARADMALYKSKQTGRDRITVD